MSIIIYWIRESFIVAQHAK